MSEEHIYYDLDIINSDSMGLQPDQPLNFTETRNTPYVDDPTQYFMSIVRFEISDTSSLPVFVPEIEPNQASPNKTVYQICLKIQAVSSGNVSVYYYGNGALPTSPVGKQQENSLYYHCYSYEKFMTDINAAFVSAYQSLRTATNNVIPLSTDNIPFLTFDNTTKKFRLYAIDQSAGVSYNTNGAGAYTIKIFMNHPLKTLLSSFQTIDHQHVRDTSLYPLRYEILLSSLNNRENLTSLSNITTPRVNASNNFIFTTSQDLDISIWNPISSIVFTSFVIPVVPTNTSTPSSLLYNSGNNNNSANIITDFQVAIDANNSYRPSLLYIPSSEYRLFSLNNSQSLNTIDIRVWWKDKYGRLNPFLLPGGAFANMKIMFRKKIFNNQ